MKTRFLGTQIPYAQGMQAMREAINKIDTLGNQLLFLEHTDTITITRQHGAKSIFLSEAELQKRGISLVETDRGGDATFHGTGQLVGYPILKLPRNIGVVDYVRGLEMALMGACQELGVKNVRCLGGKTGVWVGSNKLVAIGVGVSRQVTRHGFALNITTNLERFTECMTPCGLVDFGVTSLERELGHAPGLKDVIKVLSWHLQEIC